MSETTHHHVEHMPLDRLIPYARNARTHSDGQVAQIAGSIAEFGFNVPCLVDERGVLIAGHGRLMAARRLGLAEVPVIAAETTGRVCLGIEIDPRYCDVIVNRWQTLTGGKAVLEADGSAFDDLAAARPAA